jgi:solute carrier family 25, member 39/40
MAGTAANQSASLDAATTLSAARRTTSPVDGGEAASAGCWSCISTKKSPLEARIIAGSVGSILTSLIVTPLEVAKVRTQAMIPPPAAAAAGTIKGARLISAPVCPNGCMVLFNGHMDCFVTKESFPSAFCAPNGGKTAATATAVRPPTSPTGVFSVLRKIFVEEGFAGIYAGLRPTLIMAVPNTVLYFSTYEELIWRLRNHNKSVIASDDAILRLPSSEWYYPLVAGSVARIVASSATAPFEYIRTRQAANGGRATMWAELQAIVQTDGRGMSALYYQGLRPTLWRDVPFSAIYWFCIEELRALWKERRSAGTVVSPLEQAGQEFANGAVSGMIAAAATTPFDVVKTRQQTASFSSMPVYQPQAFSSLCSHNGTIVHDAVGGQTKSMSGEGTFQTMRQIAAQEGWRSLWRGNQARMLKVAPSCAIMISSYEFGKRIL